MQMLFEIIRQSDDYPYTREIELKKRVKTRHGQPIAAKVSQNTHMLLSVIEGDDYKTLVHRSRRTKP
jgi:hypothetical protein